MEIVSKIFNAFLFPFGRAQVSHPRLMRLQKYLRNFFLIVLFLLWLMFIFSFYSIESADAFGRFQIGILGGSYYIELILIGLFFKNMDLYKNCLNWSQNCYESSDCLEIKMIYVICGLQTSKILKMAVKLNFLCWCAVCIGPIVYSIYCGEYILPIPVYLPFLPHQNPLVYGLNLTIQCSVGLIVTSYNNLVFIVILVSMKYFMASLKALQVVISEANDNKKKNFKAIIKNFVERHCDLMAQQEIFTKLLSTHVLFLEAETYCVMFLIWIVFFFARNELFIMGASIVVGSQFFFIAWLNEKLVDEYEELQVAIYDVNWYEMPLKDRKMLLPLMQMAKERKLLRAGAFHVVNYEKMAEFLDNVYSYGLILNTLIAQ